MSKPFNSTKTSRNTGSFHSNPTETLKCEIKSSVSSKRPPTEAQREAGRRHYQHHKLLQAFRTIITSYSYSITKAQQQAVLQIYHSYREEAKLSFKSYSLCPTCQLALTGKPFRKFTKRTKFSHGSCGICNADDFSSPDKANRYVRNKTHTLAEAKAIVRQKAPELFL